MIGEVPRVMHRFFSQSLASFAGNVACVALTVGITGFTTSAAQAQDAFGNTGITFAVDTVIEFEFLESDGVYQSTFGVVNLRTGQQTPLIREVKPGDDPLQGNFRGTPGNTVPDPVAEFQFQANTPYAFYLESTYNGQPAGILYSTNARNPNSRQQALFDGDLADLAEGGVLLRWDDTGSVLVDQPEQDRDFDDFIMRAGGHLACPFTSASRMDGESVAIACQPSQSQETNGTN